MTVIYLYNHLSLYYRVARPVPGSLTPITSLVASLPSLKFNIDEEKVQTIISCLQAMSTQDNHNTTPTPPISPTHISESIYQSAYSADDSIDMHQSLDIQASMYHSAISDPFSEERVENLNFVEDLEGVAEEEEVGEAKEKKQRKSFMVRERQFCAQLAVNEVLLSISSRGLCKPATIVTIK